MIGEVIPGLTGEKAALLSLAESGRGGAMVPKSMEANWRALPAPGPSSSSEESSLSEPTTDHSSSSGRTREGLAPVGWGCIGSGDLADCICGRRWNGFVDTSVCAAGDETEKLAVPGGWFKFLKKGLRVSVSACGDPIFETVWEGAVEGVAGLSIGAGGGEP